MGIIDACCCYVLAFMQSFSMKKITEKEFIILLDRCMRGEATPEEQEFLQAYYNAFDVRPDILNSLDHNQLQVLESRIKEEVDRGMPELPVQKGKTNVRWLIVSRIAVAAVTIAVVFQVVRWVNTRRQEGPAAAGSVIVSSEKSNTIELPDGSVVTLEPGSRLNYSPSFPGTSRDVYLVGQAYFDVKQVLQKPFIVHTGKLITTVLGTAFNIKALSGDSNIVVTVTRGKVKLSNEHKTFAVLTRGEQVVYDKSADTASMEKVVAEKATFWMQGDLFLDNITVQNAAIIIGDRYGVTVEVVDDQLKSQHFSTILNKDDSLEAIIKSIARFNNASYRIDTNKKHVMIRMDNR